MLWYGKACYGVVSNSMVEYIMDTYATNWCPIESKQAHIFMDMYIPRAKSDAAVTNCSTHYREKTVLQNKLQENAR